MSEREALRERVGEVDALYRVADAIARATTLEELLDEAIDTLLEATGADRAAVLSARRRQRHALPRLARSLGRVPRADGRALAVGRATIRIRSRCSSGTSQRAGLDAGDRAGRAAGGHRALAFVPLVHGDRLLGKFMLYRDEPHDWGEREIRLCRTIANHIASATVRTRARTALRESREQLETIMRTVDEGIIVQSPDGRLVYANDAAARTIGFESTAELLASDRTETLARFEMLDALGNPLSPDDLPGPARAPRRVVGARSCGTAFAPPARSAGRSCARTRCTTPTETSRSP